MDIGELQYLLSDVKSIVEDAYEKTIDVSDPPTADEIEMLRNNVDDAYDKLYSALCMCLDSRSL